MPIVCLQLALAPHTLGRTLRMLDIVWAASLSPALQSIKSFKVWFGLMFKNSNEHPLGQLTCFNIKFSICF